MSDAKDPRLSRSHIIHAGRLKQLRLNQLAVNGGSAYIAQRLSRLPFESDVSWNGIPKKGQTWVILFLEPRTISHLNFEAREEFTTSLTLTTRGILIGLSG